VHYVARYRAGEKAERDRLQEVAGHEHRVRQHCAAAARQEQQVSDGEQATSGVAREESNASDAGLGRQ